jgi:hypothetical protein
MFGLQHKKEVVQVLDSFNFFPYKNMKKEMPIICFL